MQPVVDLLCTTCLQLGPQSHEWSLTLNERTLTHRALDGHTGTFRAVRKLAVHQRVAVDLTATLLVRV